MRYPVFMLPLLVFSVAALGGAKPPAKTVAKAQPVVTRLEISPSSVKLSGPLATQRLLVTGVLADGSRRDVTVATRYTSSSPKVAAVSSSGEIATHADGSAAILVRLGKVEARVPVTVTGSKQPIGYSFVNDVVPMLSRIGCNAGTCHGAQQGKGGFRLSLRGYAPEMDFLSITRQLGGRRISREAPEKSLFLRKPLLEVGHRGGRKLEKGTREYNTLLGWLHEGAPGPTGKEPTLDKLEVVPGGRQMKPGGKQRLIVRALFSDGHAEDVTGRALFVSNDLAVATVTDAGTVTQQRAGETAVVAKYMTKLAVARFTAPFEQKVSEAAYRQRHNYVDDHVNAKLKQLHNEPSGLCTDEEFLRRACIDAIGTLPTADEARTFLDDRDPKKREKLVDALLQRPEFGEIWALKFGDLFVLRKEYLNRKYAMLLQQWLADQFNANRGWDKVATDIITATGDLDANRGGLFYISRVPQKPNEGTRIRHPEATGEMVATVFLGNRIQCAKCHNHPTEAYTQDDYYHFAALFQQLTGKGGNDEGVPEKIEATANGDVRQPRTNELMQPRPLDRADLGFGKDEDRRQKFAAWLVRQDDFARNIVNRLWYRCFGSGIIDPVDDIRSSNPPKNDTLMNALTGDLRAHNFDLKYLLKTIMASAAYQRSAVPNKTNKIDTRLFSHFMPRRMQAEELADALAQVTGVPDRYPGVPLGTRAIELADTEIPSIMLDTFGRPPRVMPLESERTCDPAMSQALALLNGEAVQQKVKSGDCVLNALLKSGKSDADILEELFLSALARRPSPAESKAMQELITKAPKRDEGLQDALWAILNSKEFIFNH